MWARTFRCCFLIEVPFSLQSVLRVVRSQCYNDTAHYVKTYSNTSLISKGHEPPLVQSGARVTLLLCHYITIRQTCNLTPAGVAITHLRIGQIYNPQLTRLLYKLHRFIFQLNYTISFKCACVPGRNYSGKNWFPPRINVDRETALQLTSWFCWCTGLTCFNTPRFQTYKTCLIEERKKTRVCKG